MLKLFHHYQMPCSTFSDLLIATARGMNLNYDDPWSAMCCSMYLYSYYV